MFDEILLNYPTSIGQLPKRVKCIVLEKEEEKERKKRIVKIAGNQKQGNSPFPNCVTRCSGKMFPPCAVFSKSIPKKDGEESCSTEILFVYTFKNQNFNNFKQE